MLNEKLSCFIPVRQRQNAGIDLVCPIGLEFCRKINH